MKKFSLTLLTIGACCANAMLASSASAALTTYSSFTYWTEDVVAAGNTVATETFNSYNGYYNSPLTGSAGGISWSASANGGLYCNGELGYLSSNYPAPATFTFTPGVTSVGGNIFGTDAYFGLVDAKITVTLADGSSYVARTTGPTDFVGFISSGPAIASMTINAVTPPGSNNVYVTADNLYFGVVPAPGSVALLACAGLSATRRRRN